MFIAALFTVAKIWKQSKYQSIDEWIRSCDKYRYAKNILLSHKKMRKNEILSFLRTQLDLGVLC